MRQSASQCGGSLIWMTFLLGIGARRAWASRTRAGLQFWSLFLTSCAETRTGPPSQRGNRSNIPCIGSHHYNRAATSQSVDLQEAFLTMRQVSTRQRSHGSFQIQTDYTDTRTFAKTLEHPGGQLTGDPWGEVYTENNGKQTEQRTTDNSMSVFFTRIQLGTSE